VSTDVCHTSKLNYVRIPAQQICLHTQYYGTGTLFYHLWATTVLLFHQQLMSAAKVNDL